MPTQLCRNLPFAKAQNNKHDRVRNEDCAEAGTQLHQLGRSSRTALERVGRLSDPNISPLSLAERGIERLTPERRAVEQEGALPCR
jgi:hypothetical protein